MAREKLRRSTGAQKAAKTRKANQVPGAIRPKGRTAALARIAEYSGAYVPSENIVSKTIESDRWRRRDCLFLTFFGWNSVKTKLEYKIRTASDYLRALEHFFNDVLGEKHKLVAQFDLDSFQDEMLGLVVNGVGTQSYDWRQICSDEVARDDAAFRNGGLGVGVELHGNVVVVQQLSF